MRAYRSAHLAGLGRVSMPWLLLRFFGVGVWAVVELGLKGELVAGVLACRVLLARCALSVSVVDSSVYLLPLRAPMSL